MYERIKLDNQVINVETLTQLIDITKVRELLLKNCEVESIERFPEMPNLTKLTLEYCKPGKERGTVFYLHTQPKLTDVSFFRCDFTDIDFPTKGNFKRITVKQCRYLKVINGLEGPVVVSLVVSKCPNLAMAINHPMTSMETFGWREMSVDSIPTQYLSAVKWLDLTDSTIKQDPNFNDLLSLCSFRMERLTRKNKEPLVIPANINSVITHDPDIIIYSQECTKVIIPGQGKGKKADTRYMSKTVKEKMIRHGAKFKDESKEPIKKRNYKQKEPEVVQEEPTFPEELKNSSAHKAYLKKVQDEKWEEFTQKEFQHFLIQTPQHAMVQLGICSCYKLGKRLRTISGNLISKNPQWALLRPANIVTGKEVSI